MSQDTPKVHKPDPKPEAPISTQPNDVAPPVELTAMVENLLNELQEKFSEHSKKILGKLNDMSARIDELEKSLEKVLQQEETNEATKQ